MKFKLTCSVKPSWNVLLWAETVLLIILTAQYGSVSSAPLSSSSSSQSFYDKLYENATEKSCSILPKVTKVDSNYTSSKINQLCDSNNVVVEGDVNTSKDNVAQKSICNSLTNIFPMLCQSQNSVKNTTVNTTVVDLMKIGGVGITKLCSNLVDVIKNVSQLTGVGSGSIVSPFMSELSNSGNGKDRDASSCLLLCKNSPGIREGFKEYSKLDVHPACLLLLEGYTIYQQVLNQNAAGKDVVKTAPVTEGIISSSKTSQTGSVSITTAEVAPKEDKSSGTVAAVTQNANKIESTKNEKIEGTSTSTSTDFNKEKPAKESAVAPQNNQTNSGAKQDTSEKLTTVAKLADIESDQSSKLPASEDIGKNLAQDKNALNQKISSSSSSTTTTVATIDARVNDEPLPIESGNKLKSSTAIPATKDDIVVTSVGNKKGTNDGAKTSGSDLVVENKDIATGQKVQSQKPMKPVKKNDENEMMAELGEGEDDGAEYNPGEDVDTGAMKPPSKFDEDKEIEIPQPDIQNRGGYEQDNSYKPAKTPFSGGDFTENIDFSRGTTINVSLKESEDTGFFNYFLFCVTLVGIIYLVIHNKKKLIAFVVEGKRPRSRSRRSSSSSQYRRLENNFD